MARVSPSVSTESIHSRPLPLTTVQQIPGGRDIVPSNPRRWLIFGRLVRKCVPPNKAFVKSMWHQCSSSRLHRVPSLTLTLTLTDPRHNSCRFDRATTGAPHHPRRTTLSRPPGPTCLLQRYLTGEYRQQSAAQGLRGSYFLNGSSAGLWGGGLRRSKRWLAR